MFYLVFSLLFFLLQSFLILSFSINIWPEIFLFSWLVQRGLLPYRDFFDHHGFLLYYILAPLTADKTLIFFRYFYFFIISINLFLVLFILKNIRSKLGFLFGGFMYILINVFISENNLWFEIVITTLLLVVYIFLTIKKFRFKPYILGFLIALASFIKPIAGIFLIPVLVVNKNIKILIIFLISWMLIILYFIINRSFFPLINGLFLFNSFLLKNYHLSTFSDNQFLINSFYLTCISILLLQLSKKIKNVVPLMIFLLFSSVFFLLGIGKNHLLPTSTFFTLLIIYTMKYTKPFYKFLFLILLSIYLISFTQKFKHYYYFNHNRINRIENKINEDIISTINNFSLKNKNVYILGEGAELYYKLNKLPPTYFPINFPLIGKYFSNYEEIVISDIKNNKVDYVIIYKDSKGETNFLTLYTFIIKNYYLLTDQKDFQIYYLK